MCYLVTSNKHYLILRFITIDKEKRVKVLSLFLHLISCGVLLS